MLAYDDDDKTSDKKKSLLADKRNFIHFSLHKSFFSWLFVLYLSTPDSSLSPRNGHHSLSQQLSSLPLKYFENLTSCLDFSSFWIMHESRRRKSATRRIRWPAKETGLFDLQTLQIKVKDRIHTDSGRFIQDSYKTQPKTLRRRQEILERKW